MEQQTDLQALKLTVMALIQVLASKDILERENWNGLLDRVSSSIGALELTDAPEAAVPMQMVADAIGFYKIADISQGDGDDAI